MTTIEPRLCDECIFRKAATIQSCGQSEFRSTIRTALGSNTPWESAEITHPFHPLRGQRFAVLKIRKVGGVECLSLRGTAGGTFAVPRDWTDRGDCSEYANLGGPAGFFDFGGLVRVAQLLEELRNSVKRRGCK